MKRRNIVMTLLLAIGLMIIPQMGTAGMTPLSEEQLNNVVGQAGISFQIDKLNWNITIDTLSYGDTDGLGPGTNTTAGYFSLCGIVFKGAAQFTDPLTVDVVTTGNGTGHVGLNSLSMTMTGMTLQVERFSIDAIRLGSAPGAGNSLGSIYNVQHGRQHNRKGSGQHHVLSKMIICCSFTHFPRGMSLELPGHILHHYFQEADEEVTGQVIDLLEVSESPDYLHQKRR